MKEPRLDWLRIAKDLASHLASIRDLAVAQRVLDDAVRDASSLGSPNHFWTAVAAEYHAGCTAHPDRARVHQMILAKSRISGNAAP